MKIALAADHAGFELKQSLVAYLQEKGHELLELGAFSDQPIDYPDKANELTKAIKSGQAELGILVCGSGIGMSIAANRQLGIRAALASSLEHVLLARAHNDANVLCLGSRLTPLELALRITDAFLATPFEGGRHLGRLEKLDAPCP